MIIICHNLKHTCSAWNNGKCMMINGECVFQGKKQSM